MKMREKQVKRTERGWPGHFICADSCKFRRNTLLECGETKLVVSTIGSMYLPSEGYPLEIGAGRYYETMVFHAAPAGPYWDADVSRQISSFEPKWAIGTLHESADNEANDMHEAVVAWFQEKLAAGKTFDKEVADDRV
jgi:hypothetical protein